MDRSEPRQQPAGDAPRALWLSTIAFTLCFAVWTIFSIIGIQIKRDLGLTETEFGLLVGTPVLTGSLVRIVLGVWTDRYGGRLVYTATMLAAAIATFLLAYAETYSEVLITHLKIGHFLRRRPPALGRLRGLPNRRQRGRPLLPQKRTS